MLAKRGGKKSVSGKIIVYDTGEREVPRRQIGSIML